MARVRIWTQEAIIAALLDAGAERGRAWTRDEWRQAGRRPSVATIEQRLGDWTHAWAAAGYAPVWCPRALPRVWTPERIVAALRAAAGDGLRMTAAAWRRDKREPSVRTVQVVMGSWAAALVAAGLRSPTPMITDEALAQSYAALVSQLGRRPRQIDWDAWPERPCSARHAWPRMRWPKGDAPPKRRVLPLDRIGDPRARAWAARWADGETLAAIAASDGVSKQWVWFVIQRALRESGRPA